MRLTVWGGGSMISGMEKPANWMLLGLLALLALPAGVLAEDYQFATNGNAITITKYIGAGGAVVVPEKISGLVVKIIGDTAFTNCNSLTSITIPNSVTSIGWAAFGLCPSLTNITMGNSVTNIGSMAFSTCMSLPNITIPQRYQHRGWGVLSLYQTDRHHDP